MAAKLSKPQRKALEVMEAAGGPVKGWKRASVAPGDYLSRPWRDKKSSVYRVNYLAAGKLRDLGLCLLSFPNRSWSAYTHDYEYAITDLGREALRGPA